MPSCNRMGIAVKHLSILCVGAMESINLSPQTKLPTTPEMALATGKYEVYCNRDMRERGWDVFISQVKGGATGPCLPLYGTAAISNGSDGCNVKLVQLKIGGLVVDGKFGPKTEAKVKEFQKVHKLAVDGVVGPITWGALFA